MKTFQIANRIYFFAILIASLIIFFVPRGFGADSITENFQNSTISPLLQNTSGYVFGPNASPVGTAQQTSSENDRSYISTVATDYNNFDFIYDLTITVNGFISQGPANCVFMGIGTGQPDQAFYTEPLMAGYLRADQTDFAGGVLYFEISFGQVPHTAFQVNPETAPGDGTHLLQIKKIGDTITFSCDENYTGGPFIPSQSITESFSQNLSFLNSSNCRLFFGEDPLARVENLQITVFSQKPVILTQPTNQIAQSGAAAAFSVEVAGHPLNYQWQFNNNPIGGATNANLTITNAQFVNVGNYSVVVWNAYGTNTSATASLNLVGIDISLACYLMTVTPLPDRQSGKNNLVVVTHGAQPSDPDVTWITNLCNSISNQLAIHGSNDWQVVPYAWVSQAGLSPNVPADAWSVISTLKLATLFETPLANAENIGTQIGRQIASQGWSHVHLIAHSAGAGLIQAAADAIRANAPNTVIQTTFLDPFLGADHRGLSEYGANANWSDNYFDHDQLTGSYTEGTLVHAYNVDVTWLDPNAQINYVSQGLPYLGTTTTTPLAFSSHDWPHDFYFNSVAGALSQCATNCGFTMSEEAGNWNNLGNFHTNNTPEEPCGLPVVVQNPIFANVNPQISFGGLTTALSDFGANLSGNWFTLASSSSQVTPQGKIKFNGQPQDNASTNSTGTTAWFAVGLTITNFVNFVQFDAAFTDSNNAEGLLTVYWDTNQIGTMDERVVSSGLQTYRFYLPNTVTNGGYVLGFRLDSFDNTSSSIMVTNVATGFLGITTPLTLGISLTNATPLLQLNGASNYNYLVQTSTNLVDWTPTALLVNSNGTVLFPDSTATNSGTKFYRAVMP